MQGDTFHFVELVPAMTLVDSSASFDKRCSDIDETGSLWNGLKGQDVRCFSALAFTIGTPQSAPTDAQYEDLATKVYIWRFTDFRTGLWTEAASL